MLVGLPFLAYPVLSKFYNNKKTQNVTICLFFVLYFLLLALRSNSIGIDLTAYNSMYQKMGGESWETLATTYDEKGYAFLCKLFYSVGASFHFFVAMVAIIEILPLLCLYKNECEDSVLSIAIFIIIGIFPMLFSGLRQAIAIALGAWAFVFTKKKKIIPFILICAIAITFHCSAFMLFFMYPLYHIRITKNWLFIIVPVLLGILIFNKEIFTWLSKLLPEKYESYKMEETGAYSMLVLYVIFAIFSFVIPREDLLDDETVGLRNLLLLSVVLQMFAPIHMIAMRINYYYIIFIPLLIPKIINRAKMNYINLAMFAKYIMIFCFTVIFFYNLVNGNNQLKIYPYDFYRG